MKRVLNSTLFIIIVLYVITTIIGCNKRSENDNSIIRPFDDEDVKRPIASIDLSTGKVSYSFDLNELSEKFNSTFKEEDRFIIESFELEENSILMNDSIYSALKIVIIDTEEEISYTHWLCDGFLETALENNHLDYYLSDSICDGNFSFISPDRGKHLLNTVQDGVLVSSNYIEQLDLVPPIFPWDLTCMTGEKCLECDKELWKLGWHCSCTNGVYGTCHESTSWMGTITIISLIIALISLFLAL